MPQVFVCKWLLIMGIMIQVSSSGKIVIKSPTLPEQTPICAPFLSSNKGETEGRFLFSSPGYDKKREYPNNTDCIRVLKAPTDRKVISLDFRDDFHIEPSNGCEYDYLEIRDGPYGFSPTLEGSKATYCGKKFPLNGKKILSSGQFLWLRFHSDTTIQHVGMKAVYEFVPKSEVSVERRQDRCRVPVRLAKHAKQLSQDSFPQGYLSLKSENGGAVDCTFDVESTFSDQIFIHITMQQFQKNKCEDAYFEAYDGFTVANRKPGLMKAKVCSGKIATWTSSFRRVVIRVYSKGQSLFPRFSVTMTPVTRGACGDKFACGDDFCIDSSLVCDKLINCPNEQDEVCKEKETEKPKPKVEEAQPSQEKDKLVPYHYIILGTIGALLCVFILICMFITIRQRRIDLRNRKRDEMFRRSSEAQRHFHQQQQQSQSPHSLRRDLHTPSSLEGNRLLEFTGGTGCRPATGETASLGRLNKQNGVVLMGGSGMKQLPSVPPHSSTLPAMNPGPSSSVFYDPRTVHSSRVGKYLSVPNPPTGPAEEEECLDSPIDPIVAQGTCVGTDLSGYSSQPRCKVHGDVYQRDGSAAPQHSDHQPIIHRSDSAPSKAFFRVGSATPPPNRSGANTPTASQHHQESPSQVEQYPPRQRDAHYYPSEYPHQPDQNIVDPSQRQQPSSYHPNRMTSSPVPAYSLHNMSGANVSAFEDEDGPPCICRRHEEMVPRESHPHGMVRQTSLGTPRSLRRKVYDT